MINSVILSSACAVMRDAHVHTRIRIVIEFECLCFYFGMLNIRIDTSVHNMIHHRSITLLKTRNFCDNFHTTISSWFTISSRFSGTSEVNASELPENLKDMFYRWYYAFKQSIIHTMHWKVSYNLLNITTSGEMLKTILFRLVYLKGSFLEWSSIENFSNVDIDITLIHVTIYVAM